MERTRLSQARRKKLWTLEEAAERVGVDVNTLHKWEKGKAIPRAYNLQRLCEVYECSAEALGFEVETQQSDVVLSSESTRTTSAPLPFLNSDPTMRLLRLAHASRPYREMQGEFRAILEDTAMNTDPMSRRDAICRLALFPLITWNLSPRFVNLSHAAEDILTGCKAGIIACWQLRKEKELSTVAGAISSYIPTLKHIATTASSTRNSKEAADLLAQCFLLKAVLSWNVATPTDGIYYAQQAETYSKSVEQPLLQMTALRMQAASLCYANQWEQALHAAQQAKYVLDTTPKELIPPLAHSYVYAGLATYQAYHGQKQDALTSLKKAHATFFEQPATETVPLWIDHSVGNLLLNDGLTHAHLGLYREAVDSFDQIRVEHANDMTIPLGCRVEALIEQATVEVSRDDQPRDMEKCMALWTQGIEGAKALQSNKKFNDALMAHTAMRAAWPAEPRIKELRGYITHW